MPVTEIIRSLRQCIPRISDHAVANEMAQRLDELQQAAEVTYERLRTQQRKLEELAAHAAPPNTLAAVWPGLCYDPAV